MCRDEAVGAALVQEKCGSGPHHVRVTDQRQPAIVENQPFSIDPHSGYRMVVSGKSLTLWFAVRWCTRAKSIVGLAVPWRFSNWSGIALHNPADRSRIAEPAAPIHHGQTYPSTRPRRNFLSPAVLRINLAGAKLFEG